MFWSILIGERKGPVKYDGENAEEGHLYMHVCVQKQIWMVPLPRVESGTETTVERHSRNCERAAFEFSESVELCRSTTDELHVLGRPAQSAWSLDKLSIYKSLKSISVYRFHA